jgi:hypothetical protein
VEHEDGGNLFVDFGRMGAGFEYAGRGLDALSLGFFERFRGSGG